MGADNAYQTTIAYVVILVLIVTAVLLRILARKIINQPLKADDWLIIASAALSIGFAVVYPFSNLFGNGKHIYLLEPDQISNYLRTIFVAEQLYGPAIALTKLSVLAFYQRVFPKKNFRTVTYVLGTATIVWCMVNNFLEAFQCNPVRKAWMPFIPGTCIATYSILFTGLAVPNIILDLIIITLPVREVARLQLSISKRFSVIAIFLLGSFGIIASILRLAFTISRIGKEDVTYNTEIANWALVEVGVQLVSACLPTLHPLIRIRIDWHNLRLRASRRLKSDSDTYGPKPAIISVHGRSSQQRRQRSDSYYINQSDGNVNTQRWKVSRRLGNSDSATDTIPLGTVDNASDMTHGDSPIRVETHIRVEHEA